MWIKINDKFVFKTQAQDFMVFCLNWGLKFIYETIVFTTNGLVWWVHRHTGTDTCSIMWLRVSHCDKEYHNVTKGITMWLRASQYD